MPNTVLLMSDEHNPAVCSVYGHPRVQTPAMAELARKGTVYEHCYCPSPLCLPSRSAFMSGLRVHRIQAYNNCTIGLDGSLPSYGAVLAAQGVYTTYIGKTDVYAPGARLGFSEVILPRDRTPPGDTNQCRKPLQIRAGAAARGNGFGPRPGAGAADGQCIDAAIEWLQETAGSLSQPWVLVVNVTNPHFPHICLPELWDLYPDGGDLPRHGPECDSARHPYAVDLREHFQVNGFTEEQVRGLRRGYLGCVTFVDQQLGRLVNTLEQCGLRDSTNVIYTADHGDMLGTFGMWWKCSLYEPSVRVPCIASGPDFPSGERSPTPVDLFDVQAALFAAAGAQRPASWVGTPLQELCRQQSRTVFAEYHGHGTRASAYMVRRDGWKLIHYCEAEDQLFDLDNDPDELVNLWDARPDVRQMLLAELHGICDPQEENQRAEAFIQAQRAQVGGQAREN